MFYERWQKQSITIKSQIIHKRCQALLRMLLRLRFGLSHSSVRDICFHALNYASKSLLVITNLPSLFPLTFPPPASPLLLFTNTLYLKLLKYPPHLHYYHRLLLTSMLSCTTKCFRVFETSFQPGTRKPTCLRSHRRYDGLDG